MYESPIQPAALPAASFVSHDWAGVDVLAETRRAVLARGVGVSVHEALERYLIGLPRRARRRWIIGNDGPGEIADYIVIELDSPSQPVSLGLWHAKAAGGTTPSVRVTDFQEAVAQAIKSRRWITDLRLWSELGARLAGQSSPRAHVVEGNHRLLEALCGRDSRWRRLALSTRQTIVRGEISIAQPGLSQQTFEDALEAGPPLATLQTRDLLAVLHDSVSQVSPRVTILCSA